MALTGNTVQSTYLDLVQLEQSGAGLPSHAGKEAALYDGSGAQIIGRTAQRHWLDPHPDAAAFDETWEFSTYGDANQAALESAGWTFSNCSGAITNGVLWLSNYTNNQIARAYFSTTLSGDFDIMCEPVPGSNYGDTHATASTVGHLGVADTVSNIWYSAARNIATGNTRTTSVMGVQFTDAAGGSTANHDGLASPSILRVSRVSGNMYVRGGSLLLGELKEDDTTTNGSNGWEGSTAADATTFNTVVLCPHYGTQYAPTVGRCGFLFVRRFQ